ncbi:MAG: hypothetical protein ACI3YZ_06515 [Prevotella sp.]
MSTILKLILTATPTTQDVVGVAKGISDFGMMAIAAAFFLVIAAALMVSCFVWFKGLINGMIEANNKAMADLLIETRAQNASLTDIAEGLRPETKLRIRNLTGFAFDLAIEKVLRLIKRVRTENHIKDHEATSIKIRKSLRVIHDDRNSKFDTFTYKGKPLSSYCDEEWIEQVAKVVESEIYHVDGENNARAFSNVNLAYENIKTEFYAKMKD